MSLPAAFAQLHRLIINPKPLQAAEAAVSASAGRVTAWDIPDSLRLGHDHAGEVVLRVNPHT